MNIICKMEISEKEAKYLLLSTQLIAIFSIQFQFIIRTMDIPEKQSSSFIVAPRKSLSIAMVVANVLNAYSKMSPFFINMKCNFKISLFRYIKYMISDIKYMVSKCSFFHILNIRLQNVCFSHKM